MKQTRIMMGMPITVEIRDELVNKEIFDKVFSYFDYVDKKFSPFKETSELTQINQGLIAPVDYSDDMKTVFHLSEKTKEMTDGYFDIVTPEGKYNPSGLVKGWAIYNAAKILEKEGCKNFYVDAGGDIEMKGDYWEIGLRNPFKPEEIIKVLHIKDMGIATSGTYLRGQHIYNPKNNQPVTEIVSLTVIGPDIYQADIFATAAFAMGKTAINFIEKLEGFSGYMIDSQGVATMTHDFEKYTFVPNNQN